MEFTPFGKIPRLSRDIVVTEKIDGTNAAVIIEQLPSSGEANVKDSVGIVEVGGISFAIWAQSRTRFITPEADNFGFARWVSENMGKLVNLGPGAHFGEWWGAGIQRGYGLKEKRFSLFNVKRWATRAEECGCHVVPSLYEGVFDTNNIEHVLNTLAINGSQAAPGFMKPEGIIVYHTAGNVLFKKLLENDDKHKGK